MIRHVWVKERSPVANALRIAAESLSASQSYFRAAIDLCLADQGPQKPPRLWLVISHASGIACS